MQSKIYKWILKNILPFVRFSTSYSPITGAQYHEAAKILQPGHIVLTVDKHKLTTLLIPGIMSHAAICVGKPSEKYTEVAEMTHTDFSYSSLYDLCKQSTRVVILECMDWDTSYIEELIDAVNSLNKAKYDVEFTLGIEALYCSELIYQADLIASTRLGIKPRLKVDLRDLAGLGRKYLSPDGLLYSDNCWCIFDSCGEYSGMLCRDIEKLNDRKSK